MAFNASINPDATLKNIRRIVASMDDLETARSLDAYAELAEITDDLANLDNHLTNGGDLPKDWQDVSEVKKTYRVTIFLRNGTELHVGKFPDIPSAREFWNAAFTASDVDGTEVTYSDGSRLSKEDESEATN